MRRIYLEGEDRYEVINDIIYTWLLHVNIATLSRDDQNQYLCRWRDYVQWRAQTDARLREQLRELGFELVEYSE